MTQVVTQDERSNTEHFEMSGEGGIRTLGTPRAYNRLAIYRYRPLSHLSLASQPHYTTVRRLGGAGGKEFVLTI